MKKFAIGSFAALMIVAGLSAPTKASYNFGAPVDIDLSLFGAFPVLDDVTALDFGTTTVSTSLARFALNTTDNGDGVLGPGDSTVLVGHVLINGYEQASNPGTFTSMPSGLQLTAIIQLAGTIVPAGAGLGNQFTTGFIEMWVDAGPSTAFSNSNAANSADGTQAARFNLLGGLATLNPGAGLASITQINAELDQTAPTTDFILLGDGTSLTGTGLNLVLGAGSREGLINGPLDGIFGTPLDIGETAIGTNPLTEFAPAPANPFDVYLASDGSAQFAVVPEMTSLVVWGALVGAAGLVAVRRKQRVA